MIELDNYWRDEKNTAGIWKVVKTGDAADGAHKKKFINHSEKMTT